MIEWKHIEGKNKGKVRLYALSTCVWCKKTKKLLDQLGVAYDHLDIDLLSDAESDKIEAEEVKKWNPKLNYPTMVVNDSKAIVGYSEDEVKKLLG